MQDQNVTFIRKGGRVIPIKNKAGNEQKFKKKPAKKSQVDKNKTGETVSAFLRDTGKSYDTGRLKGGVAGVGAVLGIAAAGGVFFGAKEALKTKTGVKLLRKMGRKGRSYSKIAGIRGGLLAALVLAGYEAKKYGEKKGAEIGRRKAAKKAGKKFGVRINPAGQFGHF